MGKKNFEEAPLDVGEVILNLLKSDWPSKVIPHNVLDGHLQLKKNAGDDFDLTLLTPSGKTDDFGTHVLVSKVGDFTNVYFYFNKANQTLFMQMLKNSKHIDWKQPCRVGPIYEEFWLEFEKIVMEMNLEKESVHKANSYWIDVNTAKKNLPKCPSEVYLQQVGEEHANIIDSLWPHKYEGSLAFVKSLIKNYGLGLFLKDTKQIVSWTLYSHLGGPGLLQTIESHRGKGYGSCVASFMTKYIAEKEKCSVVFILKDNKASESIFYKLGYKKATEAAWITLQPSK